jgi:SAM-dependent methyltransferase
MNPQSQYTLDDQERMARAKNYFAWQARLVRREIGQRVLEVGCGIGNFTGLLLDREAVVALDAEPACIERIKARYPNLIAFVCDVEQTPLPSLEQFALDSCVCLNVLEHIENDAAALRSMAGALTPRGVIVLIVPAFPSLYGPIDRNLGHHRRYSPSSLQNLAAHCGLRVRKLHYMNSIGFFGWWVNARIFHREAQSEAQIQIFDRWIVPSLSQVEGWIRPPFGQSLFAVLEKP